MQVCTQDGDKVALSRRTDGEGDGLTNMEVENPLFVKENSLPTSKGPFSTSMLVSQSVDSLQNQHQEKAMVPWHGFIEGIFRGAIS